MSQPNPITFLSPEEYLAGERLADKRHEYVDGEIYTMSGASRAHNRITLNIAFHLRGAARSGPCGVYVNDMKVRVQQSLRFYYPDVALSYLPEDGQWEAALLEPGETLAVECPGLRAELRHEDLFEDVIFDPPSPEWIGEPPPSYEPFFAPRTQDPT